MPGSRDDDDPDVIPPSSSVAGGTLLKLTAEVAALVLSFVTGVVTARNLGPSGKGNLATMGYLMVLFAAAAGLGLGEAGVTATIRGTSLRKVVSATAWALIPSTIAATALFLLIARVLFGHAWEDLTTTLGLTAISLPAATGMFVFGTLLDAPRQFAITAATRVVAALVTAVGTFVAVTVFDTGINGAAGAALAGWALGFAIPIVRHYQMGTLAWPRRESEILGPLVRLGARIQAAQLLMLASTRLDVVLVYALAGSDDAGRYSVALTMGALNTFVPLSLAAAAYPRVAALTAEELGPYVARLCRVGLLAAVVTGGAVGLVLPLLIPAAFGHGFRSSVPPAILLLCGSVLWGGQWIVCRALGAFGDTRPLLISFAASLVSMVALDLVLVPPLGSGGAAIAAVASSAIGFSVALRSLRGVAAWRALAPRLGDVHDVVGSLRAIRTPVVGS